MGLTLIQGPPNSGRAGEVLGRFRAALDRQPVLVVPTADDVAAFERDLCAGGGAALGGSITAFAGLTAEVARVAAIELGPRLSPTQRLALVRAAIRRAAPRRLRRSAARPGFAPAADRLIAELQSALVEPGRVRAAGRRARGPGLRARARGDLHRLRGASRPRPALGQGRRRGRRDLGPDRGSGCLGSAAGVPLRLRRPDPRSDGADRAAGPHRGGHGRGDLRRHAGARRAVGPADPPDRRAGRRATRAAALRPRLHDERHPSPPRPPPVRARGGANRARRRSGAARLRGRARRGRGDRSRDRPPARRGRAARRDRDRPPSPRLVGAAARERPRDARDPGGARGLDAGRRHVRRHLAGRALPRGGRRGGGRRAPRPPAQRPVAGPRRGRLGRAADPARQGDHGRRSDRGLGEAAAPPRAPAQRPQRGRPAAGAGPVGSRARGGCAPRARLRTPAARPPTRRGRRSQPSSCEPASRRRSCSRNWRRSATSPAPRRPGSPTRPRRSSRRRCRSGADRPRAGSG